jgi:hypothetical protein
MNKFIGYLLAWMVLWNAGIAGISYIVNNKISAMALFGFYAILLNFSWNNYVSEVKNEKN